jgi:CHAT domain
MPDVPERFKPLPLTPGKNITSFTKWGYDTEKSLDRDGNIYVELTIVGGEKFKIDLDGDVLAVQGKDRRRRPAWIDLDRSGSIAVVNKARGVWTSAVVNHQGVKPKPGGGHQPVFPFQDVALQPVDKKTFQQLAGKLARAGEDLFTDLFEISSDPSLEMISQRLKHAVRSKECTFTVQAEDFHVPWGMLYTHPDANVKLSANGENFDPRGFWGYQHIIEQFTNQHGLTDQLTTTDGKLQFGAALNEMIDEEFKVECIAQHRKFVQSSGELLSYNEWKTKSAVQEALQQSPFDLRVLYFLCHAKGAGTAEQPNWAPGSVELTDAVPIDAMDVRRWIKQFRGKPPLVFLNACQAGHVSTLLYRHSTFASAFLSMGAACVIGPQIEIPAIFAGEYGRRFFEDLMIPGKRSPQVGQIVRNLTRGFWEERNPLGLAYSLYAGADCHISWPE